MNPLLLKILIGIGVGIVADKLLTPKTKDNHNGNLRQNGGHSGVDNRPSEQSAGVDENYREHLTPEFSDDETVADSGPAKNEPETPTESNTNEIPSNRQTVCDVRSDRPSDDLSSEQFADAEKPCQS